MKDKNPAAALDGVKAHVTVPSPKGSNPGGTFSVEAWVNPSTTAVNQTVLRRESQFLLRVASERILFRVWWSDDSYTELTSDEVVRAGVAQHLVVSFDGGFMRIYRDGDMVASRTVAMVRKATDNPLLIGASDGYDYFTGTLDEVAEYGGPLTPDTVREHYAAGRRISAPKRSSEVGETTILAAGDIAGCDTSGDEATAAILDRHPGTVVTLGDNVYVNGSLQEFADCYDPTWGRHLWRTRPAPGDHEYRTPGASGYFSYFGAAAGDPSRGYYSFDEAGWHIVVLNANCRAVGGCGAGSPQEQWLLEDLAAHPSRCTAAVIAAPRFSSGTVHGSQRTVQPLWEALFSAGAEVVLSGDDHLYERFAPQTPTGTADDRGIRQFIVGTGGRGHYAFGTPLPNSEVRNNDTFGILRLILKPDGYNWAFLPVEGATFTDTGSGACH